MRTAWLGPMVLAVIGCGPERYCANRLLVRVIPAHSMTTVLPVGKVMVPTQQYVPEDTVWYCNRWVNADGLEVDEDGQPVPQRTLYGPRRPKLEAK